MMKILKLSSRSIITEVTGIRKKQRASTENIERQVDKIVQTVLAKGDSGLTYLTEKFDNVKIKSKDFEIKKSLINASEKTISKEVQLAIQTSYRRVVDYQKRKLPKSYTYKDRLGNTLGWTINPIRKIGIYVPGGTAAYPSTLIMTAALAKVAGSKEIYVVTPPSKGGINPAILYIAKLIGVKKIFQVGGAQAIAALAFGTKTIPKVDKIVGPGNIFVAIAKKKVFGEVDIDMIAGPSEVLIIADQFSNSKYIAADLIAQAEHDTEASAILATNSNKIAKEVRKELKIQSNLLPRRKIINESIKKNGKIYVLRSINDAVKLANELAPEHLQVCVKNPNKVVNQITNAGSIFVGELSAEAFGDYIAGPSHVLPTSGNARFSSPLSVLDFLKYSSYTKISRNGSKRLGSSVVSFAKEEGLDGHANSVSIRLKEGNG
ncbi:MAG: histidinol dehydrogenase [Thermodesulfobacteriota bacterium]|nr:histidinol dehydrogenase [Thermodesulfobacteriota bacterium]